MKLTTTEKQVLAALEAGATMDEIWAKFGYGPYSK